MSPELPELRGDKYCVPAFRLDIRVAPLMSKLFLIIVLLGPCSLHLKAQDEKIGWSDSAELSYVVTEGNSEANTLGFKNALLGKWVESQFGLKAGAIRAESTTGDRRAVGTPSSFQLIEPPKEVSAESYFLNSQYDRNITERFFWGVGAGWDRSRFAGIQNRYTGHVGVGNIWLNREDLTFRTDYSATYTDQEDVLEIPGTDKSFLGARFAWEYANAFGKNATYTNTLVVNENLDDTDDLRADMINSLAVTMNKRLALKVSLQWLYDNQPSFVDIALENPPGTFTGQTVAIELDELDTIFTSSLIINF